MSLKDFKILEKLGEGAYSVVYKVKRVSDQVEYALKKVKMGNLSAKEKENSVNEVRILASFEHPNIISYKEAFFEDSTSSLCIIMEYADGGDLYAKICEHLKKNTHFAEDHLWRIFFQTIRGLKALHGLNVLHRDLKSANVFLMKDGKVKLGDLNVSKIAKKGLLYTQTGTPYYASPEVWRDKPYDAKSDMWSLGCVMYEAAGLKPPFRAQSMEALNQRVQKGVYPRLPSLYSEKLSELIGTLLQVNPKKRPGCDEIMQLPFVKEKMREMEVEEEEEIKGLAMGGLLGTIQIPRNLGILRDKLPKPHYGEEKEEEQQLPPAKNTRVKKPRKKVRRPQPVEVEVEEQSQNITEPCIQEKSLIPQRSQEEISVLRSPQPKRVVAKEETGGEGLGNALQVMKLPDIKRRAPPIKRRRAPNVYAAAKRNEEEEALRHYLKPAGIPSQYYDKLSPGNGSEGERNHRLKYIYEEPNSQKPAYRPNPYARDDRGGCQRANLAYGNVYPQPILAKPSWWG